MKNQIAFSFLIIGALSIQCDSVTFSARYPCVFYFAPGNSSNTSDTCQFTSCDSQLISNPTNFTQWSLCYLNCCPGIVPPLTTTLDDLLVCANYFNTIPPLSYIIGFVLGFILCLLYIILPCCTTQFCPLYKLRHKIKDTWFLQNGEQNQKFNISRRTIVESNPSQNNLMPSIDKILMDNEILDEQFTTQNQCRQCGQQRATIKFHCGHVFHKSCLQQKAQDIKMCNFCESKEIAPFLIYCSKCLRRYKTSNSASLDCNYLCKQCYIS